MLATSRRHCIRKLASRAAATIMRRLSLIAPRSERVTVQRSATPSSFSDLNNLMEQFDRDLRSYLASFFTPHRRELFPRVLMNRTRHLTVALEDVYDPHNASACLRSCDCFGVQDVHIVEQTNEYLVNEEVALGSSKWLTLHRYQDSATCLKTLKARGYTIVATSPHEPDCELETYDISQPTVLVFGNEKDGISDAAKENADHLMRIPMHGFTESFNISVAVAISLHHLVWRIRQLGLTWQLSHTEREELLTIWTRVASEGRLKALEQRFGELWTPDGPPLAPAWPDWEQVNHEPPAERANRRDL